MIKLTPYGSEQFQNAVNRVPSMVHLYVETGELEGYGYAPKRFDVSQWDSRGRYPEFLWEFNSGNQRSAVLGYYVTDSAGQVLFSEDFPEPYYVQNQGDRIGVAIDMEFLGALGGE